MKKIIAFVLTFIMVLSISNISFAGRISQYSEEGKLVQTIAGAWINRENSIKTILTIGILESYSAIFITVDDADDLDRTYEQVYIYDLIYEPFEKDVYYLLDSDGKLMKIKVVDGKLEVYNIWNIDAVEPIVFEKLE